MVGYNHSDLTSSNNRRFVLSIVTFAKCQLIEARNDMQLAVIHSSFSRETKIFQTRNWCKTSPIADDTCQLTKVSYTSFTTWQISQMIHKHEIITHLFQVCRCLWAVNIALIMCLDRLNALWRYKYTWPQNSEGGQIHSFQSDWRFPPLPASRCSHLGGRPRHCTQQLLRPLLAYHAAYPYRSVVRLPRDQRLKSACSDW